MKQTLDKTHPKEVARIYNLPGRDEHGRCPSEACQQENKDRYYFVLQDNWFYFGSFTMLLHSATTIRPMYHCV
jgi:hypothetical protein